MADARALRVQVRNRGSAIVRSAAQTMLREIKAVTPVKTGALQRAWTFEYFFTGSGFGVRFRNDDPKAGWLEDSPAHVIRAKPGRALVFYWPRVGSQVAFKSVNHPGVHLKYISSTFTPERWHAALVLGQVEAAA